MKREELDKLYQGATLCFGQFGTPVITNAVIEPLSNATPCVSFFNGIENNVPFYKNLPPVYNSKNISEVANFIEKVNSDKNYYMSLSSESWRWIRDNCSEELFVESFINLFK